MNFKQLEAFLAFMSTGSTIGAAETVGASQSAVSRLLSQFETDLGLALFVRRKGRLHPTVEAEALLPDVESMLAGAQRFHRHASQLRLGGPSRTLIRIQMPTTAAHLIMPALSQTFMQDYPEVVLELLAGSYENGEIAVLAREADMALVRVPTQNTGLAITPLVKTQAVCILPSGHPLAAFDEIHPQDLHQVDMVLLGRQRPLRHEIDMAFRQARIIPKIRAEVHSVEMACRFVAQGSGVSIVNGLFARLCMPPGVERRAFLPKIDYCFGIVTLPGAPNSALIAELGRRIAAALVQPDDTFSRPAD